MDNPYQALGAAKAAAITSGARVPAESQVDTLAERLQNYAFYRTETQTSIADALLIFDLHDAVKAIRRAAQETK